MSVEGDRPGVESPFCDYLVVDDETLVHKDDLEAYLKNHPDVPWDHPRTTSFFYVGLSFAIIYGTLWVVGRIVQWAATP